MKVVVAYCQLHPKTVEAVWESFQVGDEIVWGDTSASETSYYELIAEHWRQAVTFVILEQDKIPMAGALRDLHDCPQPWCAYPCLMAGSDQVADFPSLSCAKFAAELMEKFPQLMEIVGTRDAGRGPKHWSRIDMTIALEIWRRIGPVHWHPAGMVEHEHESAVAGVSA